MAQPPLPEWPLPFRLRHVLAFGLVAGAVTWAFPRARAAWDIHALGTSLGDYAACMVGPTGPELLRDDKAEFRKLIRRRVVAAAPDEAPFARCATLARTISGSAEIEALHREPARHFGEYGLPALSRLRVDQLAIDGSLLIERTREAWPFVRGGTASLIRSSLGAREAMHPVAPARPLFGRGLPEMRGLPKNVWRSADAYWLGFGNTAEQRLFTSTDNGLSFRPVRSAPGADERLGRCAGQNAGRGFALSSASDGSLVVTPVDASQPLEPRTAFHGEHQLLAVSCDDDTLVAAARADGATNLELVSCPATRACAPLPLPKVAPFAPVAGELDVARLQGVTVVAVETRGIVRVVSTRDEGATWTPPSVAYDAFEYDDLGRDVRAPSRLLVLGSRLLLHGSATRGSPTYALLVSDDQGASFRGASSADAARSASATLAAGSRR